MLAMGKSTTPAHRKYVIRTLSFMAGYVAVNVAAIFGAFDEIHGKPAAWVLALVVSAPVAGQMWATLSLMNESDEFVRSLTAKQFIIAAGVAMDQRTAGRGLAPSESLDRHGGDPAQAAGHAELGLRTAAAVWKDAAEVAPAVRLGLSHDAGGALDRRDRGIADR